MDVKFSVVISRILHASSTGVLLSPLALSTIIDKILETNSSRLCEIGHYKFIFFNVLLLLKKFSFWEDDWALVYNSIKF